MSLDLTNINSVEENLSIRLTHYLGDRISVTFTRDEFQKIIEEIDRLEDIAWRYEDLED